MTSKISVPCSLPKCKNTTKDPSGRCYLHRHAGIRIKPMWGPPPPVTTLSAADLAEQPVLTELELPYRENDHDPVARSEEWHHPSSGELHRLDGPADTRYRPDGSVKEERWFVGGRLHREDGEPAMVSYHPDGSLEARHFYENGKRHRTGGEPSTEYYPHPRFSRYGTVSYDRAGKSHRIDGPAWARVNPDGSFGEGSYAFRGKKYDSAREMYERISRLPEAQIEAEFADSVRFAPLIAEGVKASAIVRALAEEIRTVEGVREFANGAPGEWVRAWEEKSEV